MNKRGDGKIISIYWFFILFIVAAAVVYMASMFYGQPYDVREFESRALSNKVADCVSIGGYIDNIFLDNNVEINLLSKCGLNFEVEGVNGWTEDSEYYVEVNIDLYVEEEESTLGNYRKIKEGDINLKEFCSGSSGKYDPVCSVRSFYSLDKLTNQGYKVTIKSVVRKTEKNVQ